MIDMSPFEPTPFDNELKPEHLQELRRLQAQGRAAALEYMSKDDPTPEDGEALAVVLEALQDWYFELLGPQAVAKAMLENLGGTCSLN